jgi:hypothetical protein
LLIRSMAALTPELRLIGRTAPGIGTANSFVWIRTSHVGKP